MSIAPWCFQCATRKRECMQQKPNFYLTRFVTAKDKYGLPYTSLILYYMMAYSLRYRFVRFARIIGELLQGRFSTNYSVNSMLAYVYRQLNNFEDECKILMKIVPANCHDVDLLFRASESAAFSGDVDSLTRLRDITAQESAAIHFHIKGLLAFVQGEANYAVHFREAVRSFLDSESIDSSDASGKSASILLQKAYESGRPLPEFVRAASNIRELSIIDELLKVDGPSHLPPLLSGALDGASITDSGLINPIVLISCSTGYLRVFADYYIRTFRRKNRNIIHFHVLADNIEATRNYLEALKNRHSNVGYSIEALSGNSQTYITLSRFLICRDLMRHYNSDVLISDIDLCVYFDLGSIGRELRTQGCDFGLFALGYRVPWGMFSIGFSYFRVANHASDVYLDVLSRYLAWLYSNGGFFSMDMVGGMMAHEYMLARGHDFKVLNLSGFADIMQMHTKIPKRLQMGKIEVKFGNGAPQ